jgi:hypothetical protein
MFQLQALGFRRFQQGFCRFDLHRPALVGSHFCMGFASGGGFATASGSSSQGLMDGSSCF